MEKVISFIKKYRIILGISILALSLVIGITVFVVSSKREKNPPGTIGNTAGNLHNSGLFVEDEDYVFFANSYAGGALYRMKSDETEITRMYDLNVRNLLSGGRYVYAFQLGTTNEADIQGVSVPSLMKFTKKKIESSSFMRTTVISAQLIDNTLYIHTSNNGKPELLSINTDKTDKKLLAEYALDPACVSNYNIYYNGTQINHALYSMDTYDNSSMMLYDGEIWFPTYYSGYIYYLSISDNYKLYRVNLADGVHEKLTEDRVDCFNVGGGYVYYQKNSRKSPALKGMNMDGTDPFTILEGNYTAINITSRYVYFKEFGDDYRTYHLPIGSANAQEFNGAKEAVK